MIERRDNMTKAYARWETVDAMKNILTKVNYETEFKNSGLPVMYDDKYLYIDGRSNHSIIIGSTGSGKTQSVTLPMLELARISNESVVVHDCKSELYDRTKDDFEKDGYNVIKINFDDPRGCNYWNPFDLIKKIYNDGNVDKATELIEELGFYLLNDINDKNGDPFWINSAINYFTGITLYTLLNDEEFNLKKIMENNSLAQEESEEFLKRIEKNSHIYLNLVGVLKAPTETRGSIFAVFNQKIKMYISKENLTNMMLKSDFDIAKVGSDKTIIYIISGNSYNSEHLLPILISQIYFARDEYENGSNRRINMILDEFSNLYPIKNFPKMLNYSRGLNIIFTIMIQGFNVLKNIYGKEEAEMIKFSCSNILYLLSKDLETLEEISNLCGNSSDGALISVEELKTLEVFEGIYITTRIMPFRTKLLPYYQIKK